MLRKHSQGTFCNFPRNHASANAHARSVRKSLVQLSQISVKLPHVSASACPESFHFPHSFRRTFCRTFCRTFRRTLRRTLRVKFPPGFPQDFPSFHRTFRRVSAQMRAENCWTLAGPQGRTVPREPSTLQKLVRQTVREQMLTNRATKNNFRQVSAGPPCLGAPLV